MNHPIRASLARACAAMTVASVMVLPTLTVAQPATLSQWQAEAIEPSSANASYWEYDGEPTLLLGGSWQDNPFNHPTHLAEWLDTLQAVGGNYLRNTMSHRNAGNAFAYLRVSGGPNDGTYDLDQWNDTYWQRFEDFLRLCYERDIIVQIEVWETWDYHELHQSLGGWDKHPFNPANNINYTSSSTGFPTSWDSAPGTDPSGHPFFNNTVPALADARGATVLPYQQAYVDKMLSISLQYPNVLYCMNNETGEKLEWGQYWAEYIASAAADVGKKVYVTDMRRHPDITKPDHLTIYKDPDRFTFVDISQNNRGNANVHWDRMMAVRDILEADPQRIRPINNTKVYSFNGSASDDYEPVERFVRLFMAGMASARFHRPHPNENPDTDLYIRSGLGLGLSPDAQATITAVRMLADEVDYLQLVPDADHALLPGRQAADETFAMRNDGQEYVIMFTGNSPASISVDLSTAPGQLELKWLDVYGSTWLPATHVSGGRVVTLNQPADLTQNLGPNGDRTLAVATLKVIATEPSDTP